MPAPILVSGPVAVSTYTSGTLHRPTVAAGRDGRFSVAWEWFNVDNYSYIYAGSSILTDGAEGTSVAALNSASPVLLNANPAMAFLSNGSVVMASSTENVSPGSAIYFDLWSKNSDGTYNHILIDAAVTPNNSSASRPEVVNLAGGGFVVAWQSSADSSVKFQTYTSQGAQVGGTGSISIVQTATTNDFDLTGLANGGFAIGYRGTGGQSPAKFALVSVDASGAWTTVTSGLEASNQAGGTHRRTGITQSELNGNIIASWVDMDAVGIGFRIFNSSGSALTTDGIISSPNMVFDQIPRIVATLDGRFMVVFSESPIGGPREIRGQMVNGDGTLDGASFQVAQFTGGFAREFDAVRTADGRIVVTWENPNTTGGTINAVIFDPRTSGLNLNGTTGADNYVGSNFADTLNGLDGDDKLSGGSGADILTGGTGNDTIEGGLGADQSFGGDGNDTIIANTADTVSFSSDGDIMDGGAGADSLIGSDGADVLIGGTGIDTMIGGFGSDSYVVDNASDVVTEDSATIAGNYDTVTVVNGTYTLSVNIEQANVSGGGTGVTGNDGVNYLYGGGSGLSLTLNGAGGDDVIYASLAGGNTINGGAGVDTLLIYGGNNTVNGGLGSDIYYTYTATDTLSEAGGDGIDTVYATWNITLAAGFEQLLLSGAATTAVGSADNNIIYGNSTSGAVTLFGLAGADVLFGGASGDTLNGGSENDQLFGLGGVNTLIGGSGNDVFYAQTAGNVITEVAGEGFDTLYSNAAGVTQLAANVEQLILYGASTGGTGTSAADYIYANAATSAMTLSGGDGFDYILGSNQADTIIGGLGNDQIDLRGTGTAGNDLVKFSQVGNFGADVVYGFDADPTGGQDLIDISGMGYGAVSFGTTIIIQASGANTLITFQGATNLAGTIVRLAGISAADVTSADFLF